MAKIPMQLFLEVLYFVNDWIRLMGYGREHYRLSRLVWDLFKADCFKEVRLESFYYINNVIKEFQRIERLENDR